MQKIYILQRIEEAAGEVVEYAVSELGGKFFIAHCDSKTLVPTKFRRNKIGKKAYLFWKNVIDEYTGENSRYEDGIFLFFNGDETG